jgi:hypothetical protein
MTFRPESTSVTYRSPPSPSRYIQHFQSGYAHGPETRFQAFRYPCDENVNAGPLPAVVEPSFQNVGSYVDPYEPTGCEDGTISQQFPMCSRPPLASNLDESSIGKPSDLTAAGNEFSAIVSNTLIFLTVA